MAPLAGMAGGRKVDKPEKKGADIMEIMLFQGGEEGRVVKLSGEDPLEEIGELIGGKVEDPLTMLKPGLYLFVREDGAEERIPIKYNYHKLGHQDLRPIAGDCAAASIRMDGQILDLRDTDRVAARLLIRRVGT